MKRAAKPSASLRSKSVYRVFWISYIVVLLIALSSGMVFYIKVNNVVTNETAQARQTMLTQLSEQVAERITDIKKLSNEMAFNKKLNQYAKGLQTYEAREIMNDFATYEHSIHYLIDRFAYVALNDEIISPTIRMKAHHFFSIAYKPADENAVSLPAQCLNGYHYQAFLPAQPLVCYGADVRSVILFVQTYPVSIATEGLGQAVVMLDADLLFSQALRIAQSAAGTLYVFDNHDILIFSTDPNAQTPDGLLSGDEALDDLILSRADDPQTNFKYILASPKSAYFRTNRSFAMFFVALLIGYLFLGLFTVRYLAKKSYRPIGELQALAKQTLADGEDNNEFETIRRAFLTQMQNDRALNEMIQSQRPIVRQNLLQQLLRGMVPYDLALKSALNDSKIRFESDSFVVVVLSLSMDSPSLETDSDGDEKQLSLAHVAIRKACEDQLSKHGLVYSIPLTREKDAILLNAFKTDDALLIECVYKELLALCSNVLMSLSLYVTAGVSTVQTGLNHICAAFMEADKALSGFEGFESEIVRLFTKESDNQSAYYLPPETAQRLTDCIREGQSAHAAELIDMILNINLKDGDLTQLKARLCLYELAGTLQKALNLLLISRSLPPEPVEPLMEVLTKEQDIAAIRDGLVALSERACRLANSAAKSRTEALADKIAVYIEENAQRDCLDLNHLSEVFSVTPQYISNIFKKYKQINIKDYIAGIRLKQAKQLLIQTTMPVREIALKVGYANEIGIIRLFKKYEGMTPGEYRQHKSASGM